MREIIELIQNLSKSYSDLAEVTNQIYEALKEKNYDKRKELELQSNSLFEEKNKIEQTLILLVRDKAKALGLTEENRRIEKLLEILPYIDEKNAVEKEVDKMTTNIGQFHFNLKRNIQYAEIVSQVKSNTVEFIINTAEREQQGQGGPMLLNKEF
ncbi:hypothetical protein [Bacillus sp. Brlt_9]|uniref:hypothetical protein n=1 Tax=Bacillus sp. Brlt_9 TaxID=3110916 RepID=UPI003F7C1724